MKQEAKSYLAVGQFTYDNHSKLGVGVDEFLKLVKDKHPVYVTK